RARAREVRSETAPEDPAATGERSRTERAMGRAGMRASERPRAPQAPILFPSRQLPVAKLQRKGGIGRIETGYARRSIGEIDLRASLTGVVDERHAERDRNLLGGHAEGERRRIGFSSAKGGPADAKRRSDALECQCSSPAGMRRNAHGRPPTRGPSSVQ